MASEAHENLVVMLSAGRVTPELSDQDARAGWDGLEHVLPHAPEIAVEDVDLGGRPARWFVADDDGPVAVHFHGGGYVIGSSRSHTPFGTHLAAALGGRVLIPEYRLAPEHPAPAALDDAVAAYRSLLADGVAPQQIILTGDSAGGGLALAAVVALRDAGTPLPAGVAVISPWTDATLAFDSMSSKVDDDIILSPELMEHWRDKCVGSLAHDDPRVSPVFADLTGLPPIDIQVGTRELLLDDAQRFAGKASAAGVDVTLDVGDGMIHIWPALGAGVVPEAQEAINRIADFATRYCVTT